MREKCFEMGTIQAFLDGELAADALEEVSRHVSICENCARALAEAEEESAFAFSALEQELNTLVPTQRLWTKINDSIEKQRKPFWHSAYIFLKNPMIAAFASLAIVFAFFIAYLGVYNENSKTVAVAPEVKQSGVIPAVKSDSFEPNAKQRASVSSAENNLPKEGVSLAKPMEDNYRIIKANAESSGERKALKRNFPGKIPDNYVQPQPFVYEYVAGEESYVKTIATLEKTVDNNKDAVLRPSERFAFERDLAVVDDAIKKMRAEVKKNPKNEAAKDVLRASYQNKIDLLNSVTEKNELMASLK